MPGATPPIDEAALSQLGSTLTPVKCGVVVLRVVVCGVVLVVSCGVLFLLRVCVCDPFLFLHACAVIQAGRLCGQHAWGHATHRRGGALAAPDACCYRGREMTILTGGLTG